MSIPKMSKTLLLITLITYVNGALKSYNGTGAISGQTPCCLDRMTTISCNRLQLLNPNLFLHNCVHSPDFAFVQCCKSCFDVKSSFSLNLDYAKIADVLLTNPQTAICNDRRGEEWCERFVKRICRRSCGLCSSGTKKAGAIYNYDVATDPTRCNNPAYGLAIPRKISENVRKLENRYTTSSVFNTTTTTSTAAIPTTFTPSPTTTPPLTTVTKAPETPPTTIPDYFVVTDQNYIDIEDNHDFEDWWSKRKTPYHLRLFQFKLKGFK